MVALAPTGSRPVKVAWSILVALGRMKSSADSISTLPALDGREAVAILPSGSPVLKAKAPASAGSAAAIARATEAGQSNTLSNERIVLLLGRCLSLSGSLARFVP